MALHDVIAVPTDVDVILGKGRRIQNHAGNVALRELGLDFREKYLGQPNPIKTRIRQEIVNLIRSKGGHFLELDSDTGNYHDVGDKRAKEKVRHVLSDNGRTRERGSFQSAKQKVAAPKKKRKKKQQLEEEEEEAQQVLRTARLSSSSFDNDEEEQNNGQPLVRRSSLRRLDFEEQAKIRQRQQRLLLLRHAATCKHTHDCPVTTECAAMKQLWKHLESCQSETCDVKHCRSSKYILEHYRNCVDPFCPDCGPVRATLQVVRPPGQPERRRSRRISTTVVAV